MNWRVGGSKTTQQKTWGLVQNHNLGLVHTTVNPKMVWKFLTMMGKQSSCMKLLRKCLANLKNFDIPAHLLPTHQDLSFLEVPFTKEEIDGVIKDLPTNKPPGPDGFNTDFIRKCWHIIQ